MSKKFFIGLAPLLAFAALAVTPVAAQALNPPHFFEFTKTKFIPPAEPYASVAWGTLALTNETTGGKVECHNVVGASVENPGAGNETSPAGVVSTESFNPYACKSAACEAAPGGGAYITVTAENLPWTGKLENAVKAGNPIVREQTGTPYTGPAPAPGEVRVNVQCHSKVLNPNPPYVITEEISEGENRPNAVAGTTNNVHPSFLEFDPESGTLTETKTGDKGKTEEILHTEGYEESNLLFALEGKGPNA